MRDQHYKALRQTGITYKNGFIELFNYLSQRNIRLALVTSSHLVDVKHNFANSSYLNQFELLVAAEDVKQGKPNPECYLLTCQGLSLEPEYCLVLEDSNPGMQAALDAGCQAAMIPDLLAPNPAIKRRANYVLEQLEQVIQIVKTT